MVFFRPQNIKTNYPIVSSLTQNNKEPPMLKKITSNNEILEIKDYIGPFYKKTPYLYANAMKYGLGTNDITTWTDRSGNGKINGIYLLYYDCIHFFTKDPDCYPLEKLVEFIHNHKHKVIMLQESVGNKIAESLPSYSVERNYIIDMDKVGLEPGNFQSTIADRNDITDIVDLLMADPEYINVYEREILLKQMLDRFDSKYSRYFVLKCDQKIVAACSTYGEVMGFALVGGVIVHPDYRRRGFARDVENFTCQTLSNEGISKVGFVNYNNTASLALHEKLGAFPISTLVKLVKL